MKKIFSALVLILLSGCASAPFKTIEFRPVDALEPQAVRDRFESRLPVEFGITESVVFEYRRKKITALGYTRINSADGFIAAAGFTPAGIKIFELKQVKDRLDYEFSFPPDLEKKIDREKTARVMAEDIWRVYFNRVPGKKAVPVKAKDRIYFKEPLGTGSVEFVFGGADEALVEKRFLQGKKELWRVQYFEYTSKGGKLFPSAVYYENHQGKYKFALSL
jgi:hypothetical protein